jgi:hypothetical protein
LVRHLPQSPRSTARDDRRTLALALLAEYDQHQGTHDHEGARHAERDGAAVGLARFGHLSYRDIASELHTSDQHVLRSLRRGLLDLGEPPNQDAPSALALAHDPARDTR